MAVLVSNKMAVNVSAQALSKIPGAKQYPRTLVIIPAYNEGDSITRVIARIREAVPWADIAVMNDGSTDDTAQAVRQTGAILLNLPHNVGIGATVQTGFLFADRYQYEVVVRNDGDGQHPPADIPRLIDALLESEADMVIGSRYIESRGYTSSLPRRLGSMILAGLISLVTGRRITDPTSGFTACNRRATRLYAHDYPHDYPEPESIVLLHRAGLKICEVPVMMQPRMGGRSSITTFKSAYYMVKVILAILISLLRPAPVLED